MRRNLMHSYNCIPVCKSIRVHSEVFSDWSEFKSLSFEAAKMDLICVSSKCNSAYEFSYRVWIRNGPAICGKRELQFLKDLD